MGADELVERRDYADVGAVQAAFVLGHMLNREVSLKYASALGWEDIWNSNVIFVGKSTVNPLIQRVLHDADLDFIDTVPSARQSGTAIRGRASSPEYPNAATHGTRVKSTASSASCRARSRATTSCC